jgi:hypothetical protein
MYKTSFSLACSVTRPWTVSGVLLFGRPAFALVRLERFFWVACADRKYLYMVLEYVVGGEFFTHLRKAGRFDNSTAKFYAAQVAMIFDYLHRQVSSGVHWLLSTRCSLSCTSSNGTLGFRVSFSCLIDIRTSSTVI